MSGSTRWLFAVTLMNGLLLAPSSPMAQPVPPVPKAGTIQVGGKYQKKTVKDGRTEVQYDAVEKDSPYQVQASGPVSFVVLARSPGKSEVTFALTLDEAKQGIVNLAVKPQLSRGIYVEVPRGPHLVTFLPSEPVILRVVKVNRQAMKEEAVVAWRDFPPPPTPEKAETLPAPPPPAPPPPAEEKKAEASPPPPVKKEEIPVSTGATQETAVTAPAEEKEEVAVRVLPPPPAPVDPTGPTTFGQRGLYRSWAAVPGEPGSLAIGSSVEYFSASDFLADHDKDQRFAARFTLSGVPLSGLELNIGFSLALNQNTAFKPADTQTIGDPFLGVRYGRALTSWFSLGGGVQVLFPSGNGFSELASDAISTRIMLAFDFKPVRGLLLTLNAGYYFDNTKRIDPNLNAAQRFSAGVNPHDQLLVLLGAAYQIGPVAPFLEYGTAQALGAKGMGFADSPNVLTIGLRAWPFSHHALHLLAAVDVGLTAVHGVPNGGAQTPPYNVILAVAYDFGAVPPRVEVHEVVRREKVESHTPAVVSAGKAEGPAVGRILGEVLDAETGKPVAGAKVVMSGKPPSIAMSDPEQGRFLACPASTGPIKFSVYKDGYADQSQVVLVTDKPEIPVTIRLQPSTGQTFGTLKGTVRSVTGIPLPALITIPARDKKVRAEKADGTFQETLATGSFDVLIAMPGYVTQRRKVTLGVGDVVILNVELDPVK